MTDSTHPAAVVAADVAPRQTPSNYPEPFASRMKGRQKRALGAVFGLENFGVNLTQLAPGAVSALRHAHSRQDEFVYVLQGHPVLRTDAGDTPLAPGMCAGFRAGTGDAHQLLNPTDEPVRIIGISTKRFPDLLVYPERGVAWVATRHPEREVPEGGDDGIVARFELPPG